MIKNFEKLKFNRKIDVLVAMHVFGWNGIVVDKHEWSFAGESGVDWICYQKDSGNHVPWYSTFLTSVWDIVRKFDYFYLFRKKDFKGGQWECKLLDNSLRDSGLANDRMYGWAETEMLAICYAGLKAVRFDLKGFLKEEGKI